MHVGIDTCIVERGFISHHMILFLYSKSGWVTMWVPLLLVLLDCHEHLFVIGQQSIVIRGIWLIDVATWHLLDPTFGDNWALTWSDWAFTLIVSGLTPTSSLGTVDSLVISLGGDLCPFHHHNGFTGVRYDMHLAGESTVPLFALSRDKSTDIVWWRIQGYLALHLKDWIHLLRGAAVLQSAVDHFSFLPSALCNYALTKGPING